MNGNLECFARSTRDLAIRYSELQRLRALVEQAEKLRAMDAGHQLKAPGRSLGEPLPDLAVI
jgi:hypothetical protein